MKRSNINWNEAKWNKFMGVVDECLNIIKKTEHEEYVEDISDMVMLCKRRMERIIYSEEDWNFRKTSINSKYSVLRKELAYINNSQVNNKLARWWR